MYRFLKNKKSSGIVFIFLIVIISPPAYAQENWGPAHSIIPPGWSNICPDVMYGFSSPAISTNDSLMFFNYDCLNSHGVVSSVFENGEWQYPQPVSDQLNGLWPASLFFYDQDDTLLYFIANRSGGYGGEDIWAIRFTNGAWGYPFNLGPMINTSDREGSPSVPDDDSRIYFLRGGTIMYSDKINGQYDNPVSLPPSINSDLNELFPSISRDGQKLYFSRYDEIYLPDTLMVSYYSGGEWQEPIPLNDNINCSHQSPWCLMIPCISYSPSFSNDITKMYYTHFTAIGENCDPGWDILVSDLVTGVEDNSPSTPVIFSLSAYPNPFNNGTNISINGNLGSISEIAIYNITGRKIKSVAPAPLITWDGTDSRGEPVSSGIYFVKATAGGFEQSLRITLLK